MGAWKGLDEGGHTVIRYFSPAEEGHARAQGFVPATAGEAAQETGTIDDATGGALGAIGATATSALSGATLGLSDLGLRAVLSDSEMARVAADRASHPVLSGAGQLAGAIAPAFLSGGGLLPSSLAARAGTGVAEHLGGGLVARTAGAAAEGAIFGAGQGASELALDSDPLTAEHAAAVLSSNMLLGGVAGAGIGAASVAVERGMLRAKGALDSALARKAVEEASPDLAALDAKGLQAAEQKEIEAIDVGRKPERDAFVQDLKETHQAREADKEWLAIVADRNPDKYTRESAKVVFNADRKIRNLLDNEAGLAERPSRATEWLQQEEQALGRLEAAGRADLERYRQAAADAPALVREELLANKVPGYRFGKGAIKPDAPVVDDIVAREVGARFPRDARGALVVPEELAGFEDNRLGVALGKNRDLQTRIKNIARPPKSERLTQIEAAREALGKPQHSLGGLGHLVGAAAHAAGPVGTIASVGVKALGGIRAAAAQVARRAGETTSAFLGAGLAAAPKLTAATVPAATEVLSRVRFGAASAATPEAGAHAALPALFHARAAELREQTMVAQDGSIQMRPAARMALTRQLSPIAAGNPVLADKIETVKARTIVYMSSKIPKRPDVGGIQVGPDNWRPSDLQIRSWARTVRACENPEGVEQRLAGGIVTPEEAEAYRTCYPERFAALRAQIFAATPTLAKTLPTSKKVALYTMTGVPTMPALQPNILAVLQRSFAVEPGTAGGQQAPKPMPSFGALGSAKTMDQPTPAQKRGG